jgi:hypothetical protein
MEQQSTSKLRKRDRLKAIFRPKTPKSSNDPVVHDSNIPGATAPQTAFKKSENFKKDLAVLSMAYPIAENQELKELILLIVAISREHEATPTVFHAVVLANSFL